MPKDDTAAKLAIMQTQIDDLHRQCDSLFKHFGAGCREQEKQRKYNEQARGTRLALQLDQALGEVYRPKPHELQNDR